jgi:hypothetical protein
LKYIAMGAECLSMKTLQLQQTDSALHGILLLPIPTFPLAVFGVVADPTESRLGPRVDVIFAQQMPGDVVEDAQHWRCGLNRRCPIESLFHGISLRVEGKGMGTTGEFFCVERAMPAQGFQSSQGGSFSFGVRAVFTARLVSQNLMSTLWLSRGKTHTPRARARPPAGK